MSQTCPFCHGTGQLEERVGDRVRAARVAAGLTQAQLAQAANVDRAYVSDIENGANTSLAVLGRLAGALGRKLDVRLVQE